MKKYFTLYVIFVLILSIFSIINFSISFAQTIDTSQKSENVTNSSTLLDSIPVTTTPIKYIVVIFQENNSFDHYFATYPNSENQEGESTFIPLKDTPSVNGLTEGLIMNNTNLVKPYRLGPSFATKIAECGNNHTYTAIQRSLNSGLMNTFVQYSGQDYGNCDSAQVMGYFDGNTVTALWNYAQHYAMSDSFHSSILGPSLPGHLNLISGQTHGASPSNIEDLVINGSVIDDLDSFYDDCSEGQTISLDGKNIGDLLNKKNIIWGWFQGGFKPTNWVSEDNNSTKNIKAECNSSHQNIVGKNITDYVVHHEPFQYYRSTSNPHHLPPSAVNMIGHTDQANHQYDISDFWNALDTQNIPYVSFLKPPAYQNGHSGYSDPFDEQVFITSTINRLQESPEWNEMAIIIAYDDSGGWYDHEMPPIIMNSDLPGYDLLSGADLLCGTSPDEKSYDGRCGYGLRLPMLVISPFSKENYVSHHVIDQSSIIKFIEDNWQLGEIGDLSFDSIAGSINDMFNFSTGHDAGKLQLDKFTGQLSSN